jgi:diguanylate cyclase (GGDEF)-like protein
VARALSSVTDPADRARLLEARAGVRTNLAGLLDATYADDAFVDSELAAQHYEEAGLHLRAAVNYAAAAVAAVQAERVGTSLDIAVRALVAFAAIGESSSEPQLEARMANNLAILCYQFFDYDRALELFHRAAESMRRADDSTRLSIVMHNIAELCTLRARREDADPEARARWLDTADAIASELVEEGEPWVMRQVDGPRLVAAVLCERGCPEEGWELLEAAKAAAGDPPAVGQVASLHLVRGRCLQLLGRHAEALAEIDVALTVYDADWDLAEHLLCLQLRSAVREESGDLAGALADARALNDHIWARYQRQVGGFMQQVWSRAGTEGEKQRLEARAEDLSRTAEQDPLTGLDNRRAMERFLDEIPPEEAVCLLLIDVDNFKSVNDRYGHAVGDSVLRGVAQLLDRSVRTVDRVARWGGEEFLVALPGGTPTLGGEAAERLRSLVASTGWHEMAPGLTLTVSVGVACGPAMGTEQVLLGADAAMYAAKRAGRNRVVSG